MEEPAPGRDHDPLPAVRPGSRPQGRVRGLLWLFFPFAKATLSLPRALPTGQPAQGAEPPRCSRQRAMLRGKPKLVENRRVSSGIPSTVPWLSVVGRGLWSTTKHRGIRLRPPSPVPRLWGGSSPCEARRGGCRRRMPEMRTWPPLAGQCPSPCPATPPPALLAWWDTVKRLAWRRDHPGSGKGRVWRTPPRLQEGRAPAFPTDPCARVIGGTGCDQHAASPVLFPCARSWCWQRRRSLSSPQLRAGFTTAPGTAASRGARSSGHWGFLARGPGGALQVPGEGSPAPGG